MVHHFSGRKSCGKVKCIFRLIGCTFGFTCRVSIKMPRPFSKEAENALIAAKETAIRLDNNYVGAEHYVLIFNEFNKNSRFNIKVSISDQKEILNTTKGKRFDLKGKKIYVLSKQMEDALKVCRFHCWLVGDRTVLPAHIYFGILGYTPENRMIYEEVLKESGIRLHGLKRWLFKFSFTGFFRNYGKYVFYRY